MVQGEGGGTAGGGWTGGYGQGGTISFRYRLRGWKWTWDSKPDDPRLWTGHGAYYDLGTSGYTYGSNTDAMSAARVIGDSNPLVIDIYVECDTAGFAGGYYQYNARERDAKNAPAAEANAAYEVYITPGTLDLPEAGGGTTGPGVAIPWGGLFVVGLVLVFGVIIINYFTKGKVEVS